MKNFVHLFKGHGAKDGKTSSSHKLVQFLHVCWEKLCHWERGVALRQVSQSGGAVSAL